MSDPKTLALRYLASSMPYQKFLEGPLKSFVKSFFLGTKLGKALQVMSTSKAVPKNLKNQECEKGNRKKRPPIPCVPVVDEVQEAIAKGKEYSNKIKLPDKTKFSPSPPATIRCNNSSICHGKIGHKNSNNHNIF